MTTTRSKLERAKRIRVVEPREKPGQAVVTFIPKRKPRRKPPAK